MADNNYYVHPATMKAFIGVDPGMSGGYALACDSIDDIQLFPWEDESSFIAHLKEIKANPDFISVEAAVELVPPFVGKMIPSSSSFKLGYNYGFINGTIRTLEIPLTLIRPQEWQKSLGGLQGLSSPKRKKALRDHANRFFPTVKGMTLKTCDAALILRHFLINK